MELLAIPCPNCGHELQLRDRSLLGRAGRCPDCRHKFLLEESPQEASPDDSLAGRETVHPEQLNGSLAGRETVAPDELMESVIEPARRQSGDFK